MKNDNKILFVDFKYGKLKVGEVFTSNNGTLICKVTHGAYYADVLNYRFEGEVVTYNG